MSTVAEPTTIAKVPPTELPEPVARRGIDEAQWRTLMNSLFPGAKAESVLMVVDYCRARKLDPLKKPCHIVPMKVKDAKTGEWGWRDVVMPGIYEYRTTAMRTGKYLGHSKPVYGPVYDFNDGEKKDGKTLEPVEVPEWVELTIYRFHEHAPDKRIEFPVRVIFEEACGTDRDGFLNDRWSRAPFQMITKVAEAAGLREAFPDEFGGETTAEEMEGQDPIDVTPARIAPAQRLSQQPPTGGTAASADASTGAAASGASVGSPGPADASPSTPTPEPKQAPAHIGVIVEVIDKSQGDKLAAVLVLDTGFRASTRDGAVITSASNLRDRKARVDVSTKPSSDPSRYAPIVEDLLIVESGEVAAS